MAIIGFPFDEGCSRNGGRTGARDGPAVFRTHVRRTGTVPNPLYRDHDLTQVDIIDLGDVDVNLNYDDAHEALRQKVRKAANDGFIPFVIGGSNDQSYFNARGLLDSAGNGNGSSSLGVINLDAHLDVRPKKNGLEHSGSPFRMLLEDEDFRLNGDNFFMEFAAQSHQCAQSHVDWLKAQKTPTKIVWEKELDSCRASERFKDELKAIKSDKIFISFDVDCIASSFCPGVSCPAPIGLSARDAVDICFEAGSDPRVRLFDMSEFNPKAESYNTGKLLALMFYNFVLGLTMRI